MAFLCRIHASCGLVFPLFQIFLNHYPAERLEYFICYKTKLFTMNNRCLGESLLCYKIKETSKQ